MPVTSLGAQINAKNEVEAREFLAAATGEQLSPEVSLEEALKDGVILCK